MRPTIRVDESTLWEVEARLGNLSRHAPQAISRALNRAVTNIASNVSKEVRQGYQIKSSDIKATLEKQNSTKNMLNAVVRSRGELLPLDRFKISPRKVSPKRKTPIKVAVRKGSVKPLRGGFVGDISGIKVFKRTTKKRLPIDRLFGPSIPQMISREEIKMRITTEGKETFQRRLDHEISQILERS